MSSLPAPIAMLLMNVHVCCSHLRHLLLDGRLQRRIHCRQFFHRLLRVVWSRSGGGQTHLLGVPVHLCINCFHHPVWFSRREMLLCDLHRLQLHHIRWDIYLFRNSISEKVKVENIDKKDRNLIRLECIYQFT